MSSCRTEVLRLYKSLLREGMKFSNYNFRMYAIRRVKDSFLENKNATDPKEVQDLIQFGKQNLDIIKRQAIVGNLYKTEKLVIENQGP